MFKTEITARIDMLVERHKKALELSEQFKKEAFMIEGAIQDCQYWLNRHQEIENAKLAEKSEKKSLRKLKKEKKTTLKTVPSVNKVKAQSA